MKRQKKREEEEPLEAPCSPGRCLQLGFWERGRREMIYTVTFNPSLDYLVTVDDFKLGLTNRTSSERQIGRAHV